MAKRFEYIIVRAEDAHNIVTGVQVQADLGFEVVSMCHHPQDGYVILMKRKVEEPTSPAIY